MVFECLGSLSYLIKTVDKELWRRHVDMIKECTTTGNSQSTQQNETDNGDSVSNEVTSGDFSSNPSEVTEVTETHSRHACAARVTLVVLCVSVTYSPTERHVASKKGYQRPSRDIKSIFNVSLQVRP